MGLDIFHGLYGEEMGGCHVRARMMGSADLTVNHGRRSRAIGGSGASETHVPHATGCTDHEPPTIFSQLASSHCHRWPGCLVLRLRDKPWDQRVMGMRVFMAGGTGVIGRREESVVRRPARATQEGGTK